VSSSLCLVKSALRQEPVSEEDRARIHSLYETGSEKLPKHIGKGALGGALLGAGLYGLPVGLGTMGLGHLASKRLPEPYRSAGYGASALLSILLGLKAAKAGIVPGAVATGAFSAFEPSGARKELYDIAHGYDNEMKTKQDRQLAEKALRDAMGAREL